MLYRKRDECPSLLRIRTGRLRCKLKISPLITKHRIDYFRRVKRESEDEYIAVILRRMMEEDPLYYSEFIRKIVDKVRVNIPDEFLFKNLRPHMVVRDEEAIRRNAKKWEQKHKKIAKEMDKRLCENCGVPAEKIIEIYNKQHDALDREPDDHPEIHDWVPSEESAHSCRK
jgi:hypothetical protein